MQGLTRFIPTSEKIRYINQLLKVGFDTIDFGSFVSPKVIPQMRDTADVLKELEWRSGSSKLLAIIANLRGAEEAARHEAITYLGFPLSVSETFQKRNTNKSIVDAFNELERIQEVCISSGKTLVVYISMGFGNPYGDPYDEDVVIRFVDILKTIGVTIVSLADTVGVAAPERITPLFEAVSARFPEIELGVHLHSNPASALAKIQAAYLAGCRRFDGAMKGYGGCPMADDKLVGNLASEQIVAFMESKGHRTHINKDELAIAAGIAAEIFQESVE